MSEIKWYQYGINGLSSHDGYTLMTCDQYGDFEWRDGECAFQNKCGELK